MKKLLLSLLLLLPTSSALAVKVTSLYQAELPVSSQSDEARVEAVGQGFQQVLLKVSGDPHVEANPMIKPALLKPEYYVQEFSYLLPTPNSSHYLIRIRYDKDDVNRLLRKSGVAYWGENRPLILVWMAVTNEKRRTEMVGSETRSTLADVVVREGEKFGLPLIFPVMDMADLNQVTSHDVISTSLPLLQEASKRYAPDALLIGKMLKTDDGYVCKWLLVLDNDQWEFTAQDKVFENAIDSIMSQASQTLAKHYVVKRTKQSLSLKVEVTGVTEHEDLAQLMQYLKQLTPVQQVQLSEVSGDTVEVGVKVFGSMDNFLKNASIGKHLVLKSQDLPNNKLFYEWVS